MTETLLLFECLAGGDMAPQSLWRVILIKTKLNVNIYDRAAEETMLRTLMGTVGTPMAVGQR